MNYSFLEFNSSIVTGCGTVPLPILYGNDLAFYWLNPMTTVDICSLTGSIIKSNIGGYYSASREHFKMNENIGALLSFDTCFRLRINTSSGSLYSNPFIYTKCEDNCSATVAYSCNESQFGFDYSDNSNSYNSIRLPLVLKNKRHPQTQKLYIKSTGERVVLSNTIGYEWELETDYMPEHWHEKLVVALSHDDVLINGIRVTQEGEYALQWQDVIDEDCGVKLVKGVTKVRGDSVMRNSNC